MSYKITVKEGNLLEEQDATFVVNSTNTKLLLSHGVSMAFKFHCGIALQKEMIARIKKLDFSPKKGDVIATSSCEATNFKYALHATIVEFSREVEGAEKFPTIKTIYDALKNIESYMMWYSKEKKAKNIKLVLPLLGCGLSGLSKGSVIGLYKSFFLREVFFDCEVVIYGYTREDYNLINEILI
jgi:O-acetyl-ADP-ribose deacetylase (regulator of RNase III)